MTAPARRKDAANVPVASRKTAPELYGEAVAFRQDWLAFGLSTQPADRAAAQRSLISIYARLGRARPRFEWVDSPLKALPLIAGLPTLDQLHRWIRDPIPTGTPPLASDLALLVSRLRGELSRGIVHSDPELTPARKGKGKQPWPDSPPLHSLETGVPFGVVFHRGIRNALYRSLAHGFYLPVRAALASGKPLPVCWYGQHDASWVAYYDILHRLGLARYGPDEVEHFDEWATLVRSCGWWWPGDGVCVVVERPEVVRTEPVPGTWHDEVRLGTDGVTYRDGWRP
jgi:hypothetical protein